MPSNNGDWSWLLQTAPKAAFQTVSIEADIDGKTDLWLNIPGTTVATPWGVDHIFRVTHQQAQVLAAYQSVVIDFLAVTADWLVEHQFLMTHHGSVWPPGTMLSLPAEKPDVLSPQVIQFNGFNHNFDAFGLLLPGKVLVSRSHRCALTAGWAFVAAFAATPLSVWQQAWEQTPAKDKL